jgi:mono/diheme cytochrome c family protein
VTVFILQFRTRQTDAGNPVFGAIMSLSRFFCGMAGVLFAGANLLAAGVQSSNTAVVTPPVYVPSLSRASGPLPDGILWWDATTKETNVTADTSLANFVFNFSNVSSNPVVIMSVRPSCGCTTTKLPPLPWTLQPGTNGQMEATVNLAGKSGTLLKTLMVYTDRGSKMLVLKITILPFVMPVLSEADRARNVKMTQADRQAVFKGECVTCHVHRGEGKYGQELYEADCAICHESVRRATMVPDLHALKTPTNFEFWRTWVTHGKPGSLMPAFSTVDGGPLSDMQIASLANYLNGSIKSH